MRALEADVPNGVDVFNLADRHVPDHVVDIQRFLEQGWPDVPNRTRGNECLLGTDKIRSVLGYDPKPGGTYFDIGVMW